VWRYPSGHYDVFAEKSIRQMITDNGGYDVLELRRIKKKDF